MEPQALASFCLTTYLQRVEGSDPYEHRYTFAHYRPDWFADLVRECHFGLCPNDWSYRFVRDALTLCENCDTDGPQVDIDSEYPYTADRLQWFASSLERPDWCDRFAEDFGHSERPVLEVVASGMWMELEAVAQAVWSALVQQSEAAEVE